MSASDQISTILGALYEKTGDADARRRIVADALEAAKRSALEEAARVCDERAGRYWSAACDPTKAGNDADRAFACRENAAAIRALAANAVAGEGTSAEEPSASDLDFLAAVLYADMRCYPDSFYSAHPATQEEWRTRARVAAGDARAALLAASRVGRA